MKKLVYLIVAIVLLGLVLNPLAQALPQGEGVQQLPPGEALGRESENICEMRNRGQVFTFDI